DVGAPLLAAYLGLGFQVYIGIWLTLKSVNRRLYKHRSVVSIPGHAGGERHHFGWADGSSAIHLLQCIALAVSTRPIQWRAQLGKNPRDGRRLLFTGHLVGTARSRGRVLPKRLRFSCSSCGLSIRGP